MAEPPVSRMLKPPSSSAQQGISIGIDIGTSHYSAAVWSGSRVKRLENTRNYQNQIQSYATLRDEISAHGVSNQSADDELHLAASYNIKRLVGRIDTDPIFHAGQCFPFLVQTLNIGVRPSIAALVQKMWRSTPPEEVLLLFLNSLKAEAQKQLDRPVCRVILTIPVSFTRYQKALVKRACALAGLPNPSLIPEPTAVALLYAHQQQQQNVHQSMMGCLNEKIVLIFNMGAGFCDVAVAAIRGGEPLIKALAGNAVGGEDILLNTMRHLLPDMDRRFSTYGIEEIARLGLLRVDTQDAIHKLSSQFSVQISIDLGNGRKKCKVLDRKEFEQVNREIFEKCERLIKGCLHDAKVEIRDINDVILVGGCSNIPKLRKIVMGVCKKVPYMGINLLDAAVQGAALEAAVASQVSKSFRSLKTTIQATPLSIGVKADGNSFIPIIHQNTKLPIRCEMDFTTARDDQAEALIIVCEGSEKTVEKNQLLGYLKIRGIPKARRGVPIINVCFNLNAENDLTVFAGLIMLGAKIPGALFMEAGMGTVYDGHGWRYDVLNTTYGSTLDLATIQKKGAHLI